MLADIASTRSGGRALRLAAALLPALALAFSYVAHVVQPRVASAADLLLFGLYLTLLLAPLAHRALFRYALPRLRSWRRRELLFWCGVALLTALALLRPLPAAIFPQHHRLEIAALGERNPSAQGSQVWLIGVIGADGRQLGFDALERQGVWKEQNRWLMADSGPAALRWSGMFDGGGYARFVAHPWSGLVRVSWDGRSEVIDLYAASQTDRVVELPASGGGDPLGRARHLLGLVSDGLCLFMLLLVALIWLFDRLGGPPGIGLPGPWILASLVCVAVWSVYLLAFWPGLLNSDVAGQWEQMTLWNIYNEHPAAHTLTLWLITRFWLSAAAVALAQILALALVFGLIVRELRRWGVPRLALAVLTLVMAGSIVNGLTVITLWKDTLFSIALLAAFGLLLRLVRSRGQALASRSWQLGMLAALLPTALYRHNGAPVAAALLLCLGLCYRTLWRQVLALGGVLAAGYLLIAGPVYRLAGVVPTSPYFAQQHLMHQIGGVVAGGAPLDAEAAAYLGQIQPIESWKRNYSCYTLSPLIYNAEVDNGFVNQHPDGLARIWFRLAATHIPTLIRHQLCVTELIWRIDEPPGTKTFTGFTQSYALADRYGQQTAPVLPALRDWLSALLHWSSRPAQIWWIWRPALYLYALLAVVAALALRWRDRQLLVIALPALISSLLWLALITVNDVRFQYPVYLMALVVLALPFARRPPNAVSE